MSVNSIINTIQFIEENYTRIISVKEIEQVSFYSYRNFQRIFKSACNETIGSFQKRLKLENAYKMLLYNREPINNIAYEVGFETASALTKSFKQHFGFTPSEVRKHKEIIFTKSDILFDNEREPLPHEAVNMPEQEIYFSRIITSYNSPDIEKHWKEFLKYGFPSQSKFYGIIADETIITEDIKCRYDACSNQPSVLKTLATKKIFGAKYIKFIHQGSYATLDDTYRKIYAQWMVNTDLAFSNQAIIECYEEDNNHAELNKTFIYIPIL